MNYSKNHIRQITKINYFALNLCILGFLFLCLLIPIFVNAQDINSKSNIKNIPFDNFQMSIEEISSKKVKIKFNFEKKPKNISGFIVENPNRIVIDIFGLSSRTARNTNIELNKIKRLRVGIHQDKTRIVLDSPVKTLIEISKSDSNVSTDIATEFFISFPEETETDIIPSLSTLSPSSTPDSTPIITETPNPSPIFTPTPIATVMPTAITSPDPTPINTPTLNTTTEEVTPKASPEPSPNLMKETNNESSQEALPIKEKINKEEILSSDEKSVVIKDNSIQDKTTTEDLAKEKLSISKIEKEILDNDKKTLSEIKDQSEDEQEKDGIAVIRTIVFQTTSDNFTSSVVISASSIGAYTINKISSEQYELLLTRSRLKAPHLELPQFPPDSFKGFKYLSSSQSEDSVKVHLFVEEGTQLVPYIAQNKLWVKAE